MTPIRGDAENILVKQEWAVFKIQRELQRKEFRNTCRRGRTTNTWLSDSPPAPCELNRGARRGPISSAPDLCLVGFGYDVRNPRVRTRGVVGRSRAKTRGAMKHGPSLTRLLPRRWPTRRVTRRWLVVIAWVIIVPERGRCNNSLEHNP